MTAVAFAVLPHEISRDSGIKLPFSFGTVSPEVFYGVIFPIVVILVIAFCAAQAQQLNAQTSAHRAMSVFAGDNRQLDGYAPRGLFDLWRKPSLNRVAPLAQSFEDQLRNVFRIQSDHQPIWLRQTTRLYYLMFKLLALGVYFALPGVGLWMAYKKVPFSGLLRWVYWFAGFLASCALIQVLYGEIRYSEKASRHL